MYAFSCMHICWTIQRGFIHLHIETAIKSGREKLHHIKSYLQKRGFSLSPLFIFSPPNQAEKVVAELRIWFVFKHNSVSKQSFPDCEGVSSYPRMCHTQQPSGYDPFKSWKFLASPVKRVADVFSLFMKGFLAVIIVASVYLLSYSAFYTALSSVSSQLHPLLLRSNIGGAAGIAAADHEHDLRAAAAAADTNVSHILFGIGASARTWNDRSHYSELWWKANVTRGFVWLDERPSEGWPEKSPPYRVSADTTGFKYTCWYGSRSAVRMARILKENFREGVEGVRWFVMGDDDTVFFVDNLVMVLAKYDHNQMYYIGSNSESVEQDIIHSYTIAYGGGGFAISYPLAAELDKVLDGCIDRYASLYGSDQKVGACINEIGVPFTKELGFHQADVRGDPYGLLAAHPVAPLVTLHHLDYLQPIFPGLDQAVSIGKLYRVYELDPGRVLQQSFCYDLSRNWTISVSWGYTVQLYPWLVTAKELQTPFQTFTTWRSWSTESFTFNTRPMSPDPCQRPLIFFLDRVQRADKGRTLTTYSSAGADPGKECLRNDYLPALSVQYLRISAAKLKPRVWRKAVRRQCCDIINNRDMINSVLYVRIRRCSRWESVIPP